MKGYLDGLIEFARDDREKWHQYRIDHSPEMIKELLRSAQKSRRKFLADSIDLDKGHFVSTDEIVPRSKEVSKFQDVIDEYRRTNQVKENIRAAIEAEFPNGVPDGLKQ